MPPTDVTWYDRHPYISDGLIIALPAIGISVMGLVFGYSVRLILIQAAASAIAFLLGLIYLEWRTDATVFRALMNEGP